MGPKPLIYRGVTSDLDQLARDIGRTMLRDRRRLRVGWNKVRQLARARKPFDRSLARLAAAIDASGRLLAARRDQVPQVSFPEDLPITAHRDQIIDAIRRHQVLIVCGDTGSGKSTQLPKLCLAAGRGVAGYIGHTQPRRIAARSIAARIAEELHQPLGRAVGYKVRFDDRTRPETFIKVMTDGILLSETQEDRLLEQYDTLIIDEAHERSLNIDFLLGYLKRLLPRRPDLRLIITSATIDPQRFADFFGPPLPSGAQREVRGESWALPPLPGTPNRGQGEGSSTDHQPLAPDHCPLIEVSGRMYPVETIHRPIEDDTLDETEDDMVAAIVAAVRDMVAEGARDTPGKGLGASREDPDSAPPSPNVSRGECGDTELSPPQLPPHASASASPLPPSGGAPCPFPPGDILVFLPGEREIRDVAEALAQAHLPGLEILPLYARLSVEDQMRVFAPRAARRVVLATNVAETSLTVPRIRFVIDTGLARISRYNPRTKVQRLPIEPISQASARQRLGRCGRIAPGICLRLYSEDDLASRPAFTPPEILRTNLASVVLQMLYLNLGEPAEFPFIDPPSRRMIQDGYQTLGEMGAIDTKGRLTPLGRRLARLPVDPRIGRMILGAQAEHCLSEVLIIAAALAVQDPRNRPADQPEQADKAHAAWRDESSDFLTYLNLWHDFHHRVRHLSHNQFRGWCHEHFLSYIRLREWHDVHSQLLEVLPQVGIQGEELAIADFGFQIARASGRHSGGRPASSPQHQTPTPPDHPTRHGDRRPPAKYDAIHRALLTGLLANVGLFDRESGEYINPRGTRFHIFPGSALFRKPPRWVVAAEIVQTSRLYARTVARIKPIWIETLARQMLQRDYLSPFWDERSARVFGLEKVMYHGLVVQPGRQVPLGPVDPRRARDVFIQQGLVEEKYTSSGAFQKHNRDLLARFQRLGVRLRRTLVADDNRRFEFYDRRLPHNLYTGQHFEAWRQQAERTQADLLHMNPLDLLLSEAATLAEVADPALAAQLFPDTLEIHGLKLPLVYAFDSADPRDGLTVTIPLPALGQVAPEAFEWLVPGLVQPKIEALIRALPKSIRTTFVPVPHFAAEAARALTPGAGSLLAALAEFLSTQSGLTISAGDFRQEAVPPHLLMTFRIVDAGGIEVAAGKNLAALQRDLALQAPDSLAALARGQYHRRGITRWDFGDLPEQVELAAAGCRFLAYPTLVDEGSSVSLRLVTRPGIAARALRAGVRRLFLLELASDLRPLIHGHQDFNALALIFAPAGSSDDLYADLAGAVVERVFLEGQPGGPLVRTHMEYELRLRAGWLRVPPAIDALMAQVRPVLEAWQAVNLLLSQTTPPAWETSVADIRTQLAALLARGFLMRTPAAHLVHLPRYLKGIGIRLGKLASGGLARDIQATADLKPYLERWQERQLAHAAGGLEDPALEEFGWMLQEMRISLFAQELKTAGPVSFTRLDRQWQKVQP